MQACSVEMAECWLFFCACLWTSSKFWSIHSFHSRYCQKCQKKDNLSRNLTNGKSGRGGDLCDYCVSAVHCTVQYLPIQYFWFFSFHFQVAITAMWVTLAQLLSTNVHVPLYMCVSILHVTEMKTLHFNLQHSLFKITSSSTSGEYSGHHACCSSWHCFVCGDKCGIQKGECGGECVFDK